MMRAGAPSFVVFLGVFLLPNEAGAHSPHDVIAEVAIDDSGAHIVAQYMNPDRGLLLLSEDGGRSWAFTAPALARDPLKSLHFATEDHLWAADGSTPTPYRSTDGGWKWHTASDLDGTPVQCVQPTQSYASQPTVFAGTGDGLFRSDDGGDFWERLGGMPKGPVLDVAPAPGFPWDPFVAAIAGEVGFWRSDDAGESWEMTLGYEEGIEPTAMALSPGFESDSRLWVGCRGGAVHRSDDGGVTWTETIIDVDGPIEQEIQGLLALSGTEVLAMTAEHGVLCSFDGGTSWDLCDDGVPEQTLQHSSTWGHYRRLAKPAGASSPVALASWQGLVLSDDGVQWEESCTLLPSYVRALAVSPSWPDDATVWIGSYGGGLYRSQDLGESWTVIADEIPWLFEIDLVVAPGYPDLPLLLLVASRRIHRSTDAGGSWERPEVPCVEAVHRIFLSPDFTDDGVCVAVGTTENEGTWGMVRSEDHGATWGCVWQADSVDAPQIRSVAFSNHEDGADVLFARQSNPPGILESSDGGRTWDLVEETPDDLAALFALRGESQDSLLAVTVTGELWRGDASGMAFSDSLGQEISQGWDMGDGEDGAVLALSLESSGLMRSKDAGETWDLVPTRFSSPVLDVASPPDDPAGPVALVSTHYGTFLTCDDGDNWTLFDRLLRLEEQACPLRYRGSGWRLVPGDFTGTTAMVSGVAGDGVSFEFFGRSVRWLAPRRDHYGTASVSVDGVPVDSVSLSQAPDEKGIVFSHSFDTDGWHTLELEVAGDGDVAVDAIETIRHELENGPAERYEHSPWCEHSPSGGDPDPLDCSCEGGCGTTGSARASNMAVVVLLWLLTRIRRRK